ncbi:MAG: histidine phosphatase family protein, partial [Bacilli bacterium]|nr:histidine phosphatase family protein [Bacilli bacterium]
ELEGKERSLYDANKYWDYNLNSNELGVEPVQDIFKRCSEFLDYVKENHNNESVLIVAHAATIRAIRHLLLKTDLSKSLLHDDIKNCYYEEIEV